MMPSSWYDCVPPDVALSQIDWERQAKVASMVSCGLSIDEVSKRCAASKEQVEMWLQREKWRRDRKLTLSPVEEWMAGSDEKEIKKSVRDSKRRAIANAKLGIRKYCLFMRKTSLEKLHSLARGPRGGKVKFDKWFHHLMSNWAWGNLIKYYRWLFDSETRRAEQQIKSMKTTVEVVH